MDSSAQIQDRAAREATSRPVDCNTHPAHLVISRWVHPCLAWAFASDMMLSVLITIIMQCGLSTLYESPTSIHGYAHQHTTRQCDCHGTHDVGLHSSAVREELLEWQWPLRSNGMAELRERLQQAPLKLQADVAIGYGRQRWRKCRRSNASLLLDGCAYHLQWHCSAKVESIMQQWNHILEAPTCSNKIDSLSKCVTLMMKGALRKASKQLIAQLMRAHGPQTVLLAPACQWVVMPCSDIPPTCWGRQCLAGRHGQLQRPAHHSHRR